MDDLSVLMVKLKDIAGVWNLLGVQLKFLPGALNGFPPAIQAVPILALQELLTRWLQRTNPPPTLESLAEVIGGPMIENEFLASTLIEQRAYFPSQAGHDQLVVSFPDVRRGKRLSGHKILFHSGMQSLQ